MNPGSFYLLEESDGYQEKKFLDSLKIPGSEILFFDLKEISFDEIIQTANTFSMFSKNRLLIVQQHKDLGEKQENELLTYIDKPSPDTVMVWKVKKLDKRKRFSKQAQARNILKTFSSPKPYEMGVWIDRIANELGISVDREARGSLIEAIGCNLAQMHGELEKLKLYTHPETKILKKHVDAMVLKTSGDDVFAFTDQVIGRDLKKAYSTISHLLSEGTVPLVLASMLTRHYRILLKIHDGVSRRIPSNQLGNFAGIPPFLVQRYMDQTRKITADKCRQSMKRLQRLDKEFKSTGLSNKILLEEAIYQL